MLQKIKQLIDIPKLSYEGYLWKSDQTHPDPIKATQEIDFTSVLENPFIVEGALFCSKEQISIMIQHTGDYQISLCDFKQIPKNGQLHERRYLPHRLKEKRHLYFQELWLPQVDPFCEGLDVLRPYATIFSGFKPFSSQ